MTPMQTAVQDVWGNAGDAEGNAARAMHSIGCGDIEDATQALKLCIEQAKETAESARRALRVIDREQSSGSGREAAGPKPW